MAAGVTGRGHPLASAAERERAIDILKTAFVQGRLTKDELGARTGQAIMSRTYAELTAITADLPGGLPFVRPLPEAAGKPVSRRKVIKAVAVGTSAVIIPAGLAAAFFTFYGGFLVLFLLTFIGATLTTEHRRANYGIRPSAGNISNHRGG